MPVGYLTSAQRAGYGRYAHTTSRRDLEDVFFLYDVDRLRAGSLAGEANAVGYAVQLATLRYVGRFPGEPADVPPQLSGNRLRQLRRA